MKDRRLKTQSSRSSTQRLMNGRSIYTSHLLVPADVHPTTARNKLRQSTEHSAWHAMRLGEVLKRRDAYQRMRDKWEQKRRVKKRAVGINREEERNVTRSEEPEAGPATKRGRSKSVASNGSVKSTKGKGKSKSTSRGSSRTSSVGFTTEGEDEDDEDEDEDDEEEDGELYQNDVEIPSDLPDSDLLRAIHHRAATFYDSRSMLSAPAPKRGRPRHDEESRVVMEKGLDGSALLAIGMVLEEFVQSELNGEGELVDWEELEGEKSEESSDDN